MLIIILLFICVTHSNNIDWYKYINDEIKHYVEMQKLEDNATQLIKAHFKGIYENRKPLLKKKLQPIIQMGRREFWIYHFYKLISPLETPFTTLRIKFYDNVVE